jgi:hypothetical protein
VCGAGVALAPNLCGLLRLPSILVEMLKLLLSYSLTHTPTHTHTHTHSNTHWRLQVVADRVMFQVPHDEMPMRVYLFCETWAKAVSQVCLL